MPEFQELDRYTHGDFATDHLIDRRRNGHGVIHEGEDGLFSQTWWPMCRSSDVVAGQVIGRNFLDGRVAIFRTEEGEASVVSAYCPHNGADLSVGRVVGAELVCAFHEWRFDRSGRCTATGCGDPVTSGMRAFHYPTMERYGLVWAFNGETPLFDLPSIDDGRELAFHPHIPTVDINVDPWVFMCNTSDFNHIKCVHKVDFDQENPDDDIRWTDFGYDYDIKARFRDSGAPVRYRLGVRGTNIYFQTGEAGGYWFAFLFPCGMHRPGTLRSYVIIATEKSDGTPEGDVRQQAALDFAMNLEMEIVQQDFEILNTIRFTRGMFTRSDKALVKFLDYLKKYRRAHPGAEFIR
jgi:nitrite reductase/ring-hydroxylating ferredoxin subunit